MNILDLFKKKTAQPVADNKPPVDERMFVELTPYKQDIFRQHQHYLGIMPNDDPLLTYESGRAGRGYRYTYGILHEAVEKDAHLSAVLEQRKAAIYSQKWRVVPGEESERGEFAAAFIRAAFVEMAHGDGDCGLVRDISELLDAVPYGLAIAEKVWKYGRLPIKTKGRQRAMDREWLLIDRILSRNPRTFIFGEDGELRVLTEKERLKGEALPQWKYIVFRPYSKYEGYYGYPKLRPIWWAAWFKRQLTGWEMSYAERFGSPTIWTESDDSLSDTEKDDLKAALQQIKQESVLIMPHLTKLIFEKVEDGGETVYSTIINRLNQEISKGILGQTLTTEGSTEGGPRGQAEAQERVARHIISQDARAIEATVNRSVIADLMALNLPNYPYPRFEIDTSVPVDLTQRATQYQIAVTAGLPISVKSIAADLKMDLAENDDDNIQQLLVKQQAEVSKLTQPSPDTRPSYDQGQNPRKPANPRNRALQNGGKKMGKQAADRQSNTGR